MITICDVARHAGVATSTVSYVLTGKRPISAATRSRVLESIRVLGYHPHAGARGSATSRTNVVALAVPLREGVYVPVLMRMVTAAVTAARRHGLNVLLMTADQGVDGLRGVAGSAQADGFLVLDVEMNDERVPLLRQLAQPSVLIGQPATTAGLTCVDFDFEAAGAACVEHLADAGHRYIGFLGAPTPVYQRRTGFAHRAMVGFSAAAMRRGITSTIMPTAGDHHSVLKAVQALFRVHPSTTALVVHNEAALGWVGAGLRSLGRKVPEDVAVIAICPDGLAEQASPSFTSIRLPAEELGRRAVELLVAKLNGQTVPSLTLLEPELAERASTAGVPGRMLARRANPAVNPERVTAGRRPSRSGAGTRTLPPTPPVVPAPRT
ncbi:LacI family DNA-binding transcriptional regulator [Lentzea flava]|uniref:LacI family transcriptional regulator n=1 Tax=Lentzea flava TaxID=103732 RepID=A0ABQ2UNH6_9PSEU|nr:LacI family DNA-binding transcriptional regulator [Lentzea flava]MCP2200604.1 transcriptional regulator, LacI family [Lentzea flava]GGU43874.1 LacI family transcriptional regulator [Lentzea flava]